MTFDLHGTGSAHLATIRRWAARLMSDFGEPHREDVLLVLTEIAQNAYQHGDGARRLLLTRHAHPCEVRIEVEDNSVVPPRLREHSGQTAFGGRGLHLVETLATAWGSRRDPSTGKTVWARIRCDLAHQQPCGPLGLRSWVACT